MAGEVPKTKSSSEIVHGLQRLWMGQTKGMNDSSRDAARDIEKNWGRKLKGAASRQQGRQANEAMGNFLEARKAA